MYIWKIINGAVGIVLIVVGIRRLIINKLNDRRLRNGRKDLRRTRRRNRRIERDNMV